MSLVRKLSLAVGSLLLALAATANTVGLSASAGASSGKLLLAAAGLGLLAAGALGRRLPAAYKGLALMLLNTVVLLLAVEGGLLVLSRLRKLSAEAPPRPADELRWVDDGREELPYYRSQPWSERYWSEYHQLWDPSSLDFEPYLLWRSPAYEGETLNVDARGFRSTPASRCEPEALTVVVLGGSAMWGTGVPDWGTIPQFLAERLTERLSRPICMINAAEQAYVSTQETLRLVFELRRGLRPHLVVFYDGINDVFAAYQNGAAGAPQNLERLRSRLRGGDSDSAIADRLTRTRTLRLLRKLTGSEEGERRRGGAAARDLDLEALSAETVDTALANYELVRRLGDSYGFSPLFFWQPVLLLEERRLSEEEASIAAVARGVYPGLDTLYRLAYADAARRAAALPDLRLLDDALEEESGLVFIDPWHVTLDANRRIAAEMSASIDVARLRPATAPSGETP